MPVLKMYSLPPTCSVSACRKRRTLRSNKQVNICHVQRWKMQAGNMRLTHLHFRRLVPTGVGPSTVSDSRGNYKLRKERFVEITCCKRIIFSS
ncbi:hypothetical protein P5V15_005269 [Pogonomyrmex californicus]